MPRYPTKNDAHVAASASLRFSRTGGGADAAYRSGPRSHNGAVRHDARTGTVTPPVNMHLLHLHVGIDAAVEPKAHLRLAKGVPELIAAAIDELGVEAGGMDTPISTDAETGRPWRPRFDVKTVVLEERMLQAAAYVVCAYLTGMRDCEVQAMRSGCLSLTRSEDGLIMRHRVRSVAYKGKQSVGEPAEWVTIAPVAQAIQVLEHLSARAAAARSADTLWPVLVVKAGSKDHVSAEIVRQLNVYRDHLNALFGANDAPVIPPGPDGLPWRITTRQFRRTIAWHIANRPFGTIAGMIQYKHASVAAFEGYAGSSRSGFRAEVEAQRALGQIDDILAYFDERRAGNVALRSGRSTDRQDHGCRRRRARPASGDDRRPREAAYASRKPRPHIACRHPGRLLLRSLDRALPQACDRTRSCGAARRTLRADPLSQRLHHRSPSAGLGAGRRRRQALAAREAPVRAAARSATS